MKDLYDKLHSTLNEISDLCNTRIIYDNMSKEEIINLFYITLDDIYEQETIAMDALISLENYK